MKWLIFSHTCQIDQENVYGVKAIQAEHVDTTLEWC